MGPCYKCYVNSLPTLTSGIKGNSCLWHNRVLWGCKLICLSRRVNFLTNVPEILVVFHTHIACLSQVGITPKPKPWLKQPKFLVGHEKMRQYRCDFRFITYPAPCQYSWWTTWAILCADAVKTPKPKLSSRYSLLQHRVWWDHFTYYTHQGLLAECWY